MYTVPRIHISVLFQIALIIYKLRVVLNGLYGDDEFYQHYSLFVGGVYLLSSRSISPEQLELAGNLLMHFVEMFDAYYGM